MHSTPVKPVGLRPSTERQSGGRAGDAGGAVLTGGEQVQQQLQPLRDSYQEPTQQQEALLPATVEQLRSEFQESFSPRLREIGLSNIDDQYQFIRDAFYSGSELNETAVGETTPSPGPTNRSPRNDEDDDDEGDDGNLNATALTPLSTGNAPREATTWPLAVMDVEEEDQEEGIFCNSQLGAFTPRSTEQLRTLVTSGDVRLLDGEWLVDRWRQSTYMVRLAEQDKADMEIRLPNDDDNKEEGGKGDQKSSSLVMSLIMDDDLMNHPEHTKPVSHFVPNIGSEQQLLKQNETKEGHYILPCRQELPDEAFIDSDDFCRLFMDEMEQQQQANADDEDLQVFVLSYPWLDEAHPDPAGFHLTCVAPVLEIFTKLESASRGRKVRTAVFWDWASLFQPGYFPAGSIGGRGTGHRERVTSTPEEAASYERARAAISHWYAHPWTLVLLQSRRQPGHILDVAGKPLLSHGRPQPKHHGGRWYERRLWCSLESHLAEMTKPAHLLLELGPLFSLVNKWGLSGLPLTRFVEAYVEQADAYKNPECWKEVMSINKYCAGSGELAVDLIRRRELPFLEPMKFDKSNQKKKLKMVPDRNVISQTYRSTFKALFQADNFDSLKWCGLRWAFDLSVLESSCLVHVCERLVALDISDNPELTGTLSLFERMVALKTLSLHGCSSFEGDLGELGANNCGFAANLRSIDLGGCDLITGDINMAFKSLRVIEDVDLSGLPLIEGDIQAFSGPPAPMKRDPVTQQMVVLPRPTPCLKRLCLRGCDGLTGDLVSLKGCVGLIVADFNGCRAIEGDIVESVAHWHDAEVIDLQFTKARGDVAVAFGGVAPKYLRQHEPGGEVDREVVEQVVEQGGEQEQQRMKALTRGPRKLRKLLLFNMKIHGEASFAFSPKTTPSLEVLVARRTMIRGLEQLNLKNSKGGERIDDPHMETPCSPFI